MLAHAPEDGVCPYLCNNTAVAGCSMPSLSLLQAHGELGEKPVKFFLRESGASSKLSFVANGHQFKLSHDGSP